MKTDLKRKPKEAPIELPQIGNVDMEQELLTALVLRMERPESKYAFANLGKRDFLMPEHGQLFAEYKAAHDANVPLATGACIKEWLVTKGGLKRLMNTGWVKDERETLAWVFSMIEAFPGMTSCVPYYCYCLRKYRIERACAYIAAKLERAGEQGVAELGEQLVQLNEIKRLEDWQCAAKPTTN